MTKDLKWMPELPLEMSSESLLVLEQSKSWTEGRGMGELSDTEAAQLIDQYAPLVNKIARSACYSSASIDFHDLCQIGNFAVLRAVKLYDPTYGASINSFVSRIVRQDIYNEAARFLGVFTVDRRVTRLTSKVNRMHGKGMTDEEIASVLSSESSYRNFDEEHVRDLRLAYSKREHTQLHSECIDESFPEEETIQQIFDSVIQNNVEAVILERRLLGDASVTEVANDLGLSPRWVYNLENDLKDKIRRAIEDVTE